jgi:hypothetical protein
MSNWQILMEYVLLLNQEASVDLDIIGSVDNIVRFVM